MFNGEQLNQSGGENSQNQQALKIKNVYKYYGPTEAQLLESQIEVFRKNMPLLAQAAADLMVERAIEFSERLITEKLAHKPELLNAFGDPGMQIAALEAQRQYARTGDNDVANVLIELIASRAENEKRNINQITIEESLAVVPKLTIAQINVLSLMVLVKYEESIKNVSTHYELTSYLKNVILPFTEGVNEFSLNVVGADLSWYRNLIFAGCITDTSNIGYGFEIGQFFQSKNGHLFTLGIPFDELKKRVEDIDSYAWFLKDCPHVQGNVQTVADSLQGVNDLMQARSISDSRREKLWNIFKITNGWVAATEGEPAHLTMVEGQVAESILLECGTFIKVLQDLFFPWMGCGITSIGVEIGKANIKNIVGLDVQVITIRKFA